MANLSTVLVFSFICLIAGVFCARNGFSHFSSSFTNIDVIQYAANQPIEDTFIAEHFEPDKYFLAVFDGHGGPHLSKYANENFFEHFKELYNWAKRHLKISDEELIVESLRKSFKVVEKEYLHIAKEKLSKGDNEGVYVGSCALVVIATKEKIYVAQLGDSKAKIFKNYNNLEENLERIKLTNTHNAGKKTEQMKLVKEFSDSDIYVCSKHYFNICYVKGRLQPTRVKRT